MSLPKHKNRLDRNGKLIPERTASAPYNFVPLPEMVVKAVGDADRLPDHSTYAAADYPNTGYFDVTLTTKSPLYVRCPFTIGEFQRQESERRRQEDSNLPYSQQVKNTPHFFYTLRQNQPVIPGSSLRGLLRSLLEIVSYGKMQWVTDKKLFFRTVDDTVVGKHYNQRVVEDLSSIRVSPNPSAPCYRPRIEGGFFRVRADGTYFIEECQVARVEVNDILAALGLTHRRDLYQLGTISLTSQNERNPNQTPKWSYQHQDIWADVDAMETDYFFPRQYRQNGRLRHPDLYLRFRQARNLTTSGVTTKTQGKLVLTGHMEFKHLAFMFIPTMRPNLIDVPNDPKEKNLNRRLVDRFHDDDQITRWQTLAFPQGHPPGTDRARSGYLRDGEPVFFLRENGHLTFFGRAQMFRLPYTQAPLDLVPPELRRPEEIDYADAMFGYVRARKELDDMRQRGIAEMPQGSKARAYAGRVFVTDAALEPGQNDIWFPGNPVVTPRILATPKPTTFQHYLVQEGNDKNTLKHYGSQTPGETVIRGHKRYWHQGLNEEHGLSLDQVRQMIEEQGPVPPKDTQHTRFTPVKPEVRFRFRVQFENLSERELGALCWTLHPLGDRTMTYCHHLGMGKPLGMGAVKMDAKLHLTNRQRRYGSLFEGNDWQFGTGSEEDLSDLATLERRTHEFEQHVLGELGLSPACAHLSDTKRIGMLLKTMEWSGYRAEAAIPGSPPPNNCVLTQNNKQRPNTRYMTIQLPGVPGSQRNEYRDRPILPDPEAFGPLTGVAEPAIPDVPSGTPQVGTERASRIPSTKTQPPAAVSATEMVGSIKQAIAGLRGAGDVSLVESLVKRIAAITSRADRQDCGRLLQSWLKAQKLWKKEKHAVKAWHVALEELLQVEVEQKPKG